MATDESLSRVPADRATAPGIPPRARGWAVASLATASAVTIAGLGLAVVDDSRPSPWILVLLGLGGILNSVALITRGRRAARILTIGAFLPLGGAIVLLVGTALRWW